MARALFSVILAVSLIYVLQASPMPEGGAQPTAAQPDPLANVIPNINKIIDESQSAVDAMLNTPEMKNVLQSIGKTIQEGGEVIRQGIENMLPKTNGN